MHCWVAGAGLGASLAFDVGDLWNGGMDQGSHLPVCRSEAMLITEEGPSLLREPAD